MTQTRTRPPLERSATGGELSVHSKYTTIESHL
ncbi:rCG23622 [Rattus norvegicus]|uniref:RCG23622 n=1 Tax=Rattus norvegicus TaxID=10116 RepID=A6KPN8_RAT|nr:rCG23622 [Rattus norvegicus]